MSDPPPDRLMPPDGKVGWFTSRRDGTRTNDIDERRWEPPPDGSLIRFMGDYGATVPLWGERGLMSDNAQDAVRKLGVSPELAADLEAWGSDWETRSGEPAHDAEAAALVRRFKRETEYRFQVLYHP